jgi:hypothetical protein
LPAYNTGSLDSGGAQRGWDPGGIHESNDGSHRPIETFAGLRLVLAIPAAFRSSARDASDARIGRQRC